MSQFLFNETLSDLKLIVRKGLAAFDIDLNSMKDPETVINGEFDSKTYTKIPVHKLVLSARCPYFFAQFCKADWADKDQTES